jgi:hypothetical protein
MSLKKELNIDNTFDRPEILQVSPFKLLESHLKELSEESFMHRN